jgi:PAS domain S-box-containing protein
MAHPTALGRLTRRLNLIGSGLLIVGAVVFVWAVGFTSGVDGLIEGLLVAGMGLFIPGLATLWVSWIIGTAQSDEPLGEPAPALRPRERFALRLRNYTIAALLVVFAAAVRTWLAPYLGQLAPLPPFLLAIAVAAWIGGMGPAAFGTAIALPILWTLFLEPQQADADATGKLIAAGLFAATALSVAGVTAALRVTQSRVNSFGVELAKRQAAMDEGEARFRQLADRSSKLIWMSDANHQCTYVNEPWCAFTGRSLEQDLGIGWTVGVHPEDRERVVAQFAKAHDERDPFTLEYRFRRHDAHYRRIVNHGRPRVMPDGRFAGFVGECEDVTDMPLALRRLAHSVADRPAAARDSAGTVK